MFDYLLRKAYFYKPKQTYVPSGLTTGTVDPAGTKEDWYRLSLTETYGAFIEVGVTN